MALFKDILDFKQYIPEISRHYTWEDLKVKIDQYTLRHIIPFLDKTVYDTIETNYLVDASTAEEEALFPWLKSAIAQYTYMHLLTTNRVSISQMGVTENRSNDGTASPASGYAINDAKAEAAEMADGFMDDLLLYMESNKGDYPTWVASDAYTIIKECFISSTVILNRHVKARNSRRTFLAMKSDLMFIQENRVKPILGDTFYPALLTQFKAGTLTTENQKVVDLIQPYLAKAAMVDAIPNHNVDFLSGGILVKSFLDQSIKKSQARNESISHLLSTFEAHAEETKNTLIRFLDDNATDYPDYTASTYTLSDDEVSYEVPNNENKNSFRV